MLSLIRDNAASHNNNPEFQQDLLQTIDDALRRMTKVKTRLDSLKGEIEPKWREVDLGKLSKSISLKLMRRLPGHKIDILCPQPVCITSDQQLLERIL
ncbi:MAG: hypothetical protein MUO63_21825 [Desulfobulbaceae bacterium]|nr:hypothetical protein [Desulfobulbaceae bacterium]